MKKCPSCLGTKKAGEVTLKPYTAKMIPCPFCKGVGKVGPNTVYVNKGRLKLMLDQLKAEFPLLAAKYSAITKF